MKSINCHLLSILFCFFTINNLFAASLPINITGDYYIRLSWSSRYIRNPLSTIPDNSIISIADNNASESFLLLDGHQIKLFPGAVFKISKGSFCPLVGRFEFSSDETASNSISIIANNCNAGYGYGHFLIEVTPDNGVFFALKNKGLAWVKDVSRKVFELRQGQQVQVPLYGPSVLKNRVEAFWGKDPSSFGHLGEIGQETAYGIVGKDSFYSKSKKSKKDSIEEVNGDLDKDNVSDNEDEEEDENENIEVSEPDEIEKVKSVND